MRDAATLILLDPATGGGPPDILMVERAAGLAFAGGAAVFPGGAVDPADRALAADPALVVGAPDDPADAAARVAAIRETIEEAGVAVSTEASPWEVMVLQRGLLAGRPLAELLLETGLRLDLARLVPWARWRPHGDVTRRFDARFYLAEGGVRGDPGLLDRGETAQLFSQPAAATLAAAAAGTVRLILPTRRNLERLAALDDAPALFAHARATPVETIIPWIEEVDGTAMICIPDGRGYPVTRAPLSEAERT